VQLLQIDQRIAVVGVELNDFLEGFESPIDEATMAEIQAQAEQQIGRASCRERV